MPRTSGCTRDEASQRHASANLVQLSRRSVRCASVLIYYLLVYNIESTLALNWAFAPTATIVSKMLSKNSFIFFCSPQRYEVLASAKRIRGKFFARLQLTDNLAFAQ